MQQKLFIRKNEHTVGPFTAEQINIMLSSGQLQANDMISSDKSSWQSVQQFMNLPEPPAATLTRQLKASESVSFVLPLNEIPEPPVVLNKTVPQADDSSCTAAAEYGSASLSRILALSFAGAFNTAAALKELSRERPGKTAAAGTAALLSSLFICLFSGTVFARYYETAAWIFILRNLFFAGFAAAALYIFCSTIGRLRSKKYTSHCHAADYLAAMLALENCAFSVGFLHSVMFYFNRNLFNPTPHQIGLLVIIVLLPLIFFTANGITALRLKFIAADELRSGMATILAAAGLYITAIIAAILFLPFYITAN